MDFQKELFLMQDLAYRDFHAKLMPNIRKEKIIGVRVPDVRSLAKRVAFDRDAEAFLQALPHEYYEEDNLHAFLIERMQNYDKTVEELNRFLPYVNNWATCDSMRPKILYQYPEATLKQVRLWLDSKYEYAVRFGIEVLMLGFLEERFFPESAEWVANVKREEYYIKMMQAWYFATGLCKKYDFFSEYLKTEKLETWVHHKTIQKAMESRALTTAQKEELKRYRK